MQSLLEKCLNLGLKMTDQRRVIVKVLSESEDHPDVESVYRRASKIDKRIEHSISVLRKYYEIDKNQMFQDEVDDIRLMLERDLSWVVGGLSGRIESSFDDDPAILKAIEVLSDHYVYGSTLDPSMN